MLVKGEKKSLQMTSERAGWQSCISDAVRQCVPGYRTRNREGPTANCVRRWHGTDILMNS